jgi:hypothetical protein
LSAAGEIATAVAELASTRGVRGSLAWAEHLLGEIAARRDPLETAIAEEHFGRTLALAEDLGMRPLIAHCHSGRGLLHRLAGERQKAEEQAAIALDMYRDMDMPFWQKKTDLDV